MSDDELRTTIGYPAPFLAKISRLMDTEKTARRLPLKTKLNAYVLRLAEERADQLLTEPAPVPRSKRRK